MTKQREGQAGQKQVVRKHKDPASTLFGKRTGVQVRGLVDWSDGRQKLLQLLETSQSALRTAQGSEGAGHATTITIAE
jgi:hypothetical protein